MRRNKTRSKPGSVEHMANVLARSKGWGRATIITFADVQEPMIGKTARYGYRKRTTGEYVPHSYRLNFGWKNTYYQEAVCEVILPLQFKPAETSSAQNVSI